jgi:hypothetical protein
VLKKEPLIVDEPFPHPSEATSLYEPLDFMVKIPMNINDESMMDTNAISGQEEPN